MHHEPTRIILIIPDDIQPEALVEMARPKTSPIHHFFKWDDAQQCDPPREAGDAR